MTPPKQTRTAAPDKGAAARAEADGHEKTVVFEGLTLTLPAKMPFRVLKYLRASQTDELDATLGLLETLLGDEQLARVLDLDTGLDLDEGLDRLVEAITAPYGVDEGNSPASQSS